MGQLNTIVPDKEPERQYYFIELLKDEIKKKAEKKGGSLTYHIQTFGCQMNARDSEKLAGILEAAGFVHTDNEEADFVIYNTCSVRENANNRLYGHLGRMKVVKKNNPDMLIAICGCMMQEPDEIEKIKTKYKFIDIVFGTHNIFKFAELVHTKLNSEGMIIDIWKDTNQIVEDLPDVRKYTFKSGVNIMYGCNNFCSYCIVPYVRGRERSREPKDIIREVERFVKEGVKEVMLLGQNVNSYGKTLENPISFAELLKEVSKVEGLERIRFMTPHPKDLSDELIETMVVTPKVCHHIHLPLQSGSSRILKLMNRHYTKESYLELVKKIRKRMPDAALTTDIIVGFPGETEEDFNDTMDVVREAEFDSAYTFIYSKREGTPAASMTEQIPEEVTKERFDRLLKQVGESSKKRCGLDVGKTLKVLVEEVNQNHEGLLTGRLENNTLVHFKGNSSLVGTICDVKLNESKGFYYIGELV